MSVTSEISVSGPYDGNGSTESEYVVSFDFLKNSDLAVIKTSKATGVVTPLIHQTDYTITGGKGGGAIRTVVAVANTHELTISRGIPFKKLLTFEEGQRIPMKTIEEAFDRVTMQVQRVRTDADTLISNRPTYAELDQVIANVELTPGPKGETGDQGQQGHKGDQGNQGPVGPEGVNYVISATPPADHTKIWIDSEMGTSSVWIGSAWVAFYGADVIAANLSQTGGAGKTAQFAANGDFNFGNLSGGSVNPTESGNINIPVAKQFRWYKVNGTVGAYQYIMDGHSGGDELFTYSPRVCYYFSQGFQFGQPYGVTAREPRFVYFNPLGTATALDPTRESISFNMNGNWWNGVSAVATFVGQQYVPTSTTDGEWQFWGGMTNQPIVNGKLASTNGTKNFIVKNSGPIIPVGKVLTFPDGSTMNTASVVPLARTGNASLVAGTVTVADTSVTAYTNVIPARKTLGGVIGELSYVTTPGVGFTITSNSSTETSRITYLLVEGQTLGNAPAISGTNEVGDTLTVASGGGSGSWQWYSNGIAVAGRTSSNYVIRHQDTGMPITCREDGIASNIITAWKPSDEPGYFADFSADSGVRKAGGTIAVNGEAVAQWDDLSGNGNHLVQSTGGAQPLLNTTTYAGYPFIDFDMTNDSLAKLVTVVRPYTVYIVAETKSMNPNKRIFSTAVSGSRMFVEAVTNSVKNVDATAVGTPFALNTKRILTARTTAVVNAMRVDGLTESTAASGTSSDGTELIVSQSAGGGGADCRVYALVVFTNADHSTVSQTAVRKWLKSKWATP